MPLPDRRPSSMRRDVGFGASLLKTVWLRLTPMPAMHTDKVSPDKTFSIRMPQIFRSPTYMSLGHLILASIPCFAR